MANATKDAAAIFQQAGELFNDATVKLVGGIDQFNQKVVTNDLTQAQSLVQQMITTDAKALDPAATVHAQEIVDQISLELTYVNKVAAQTIGTATTAAIDPYAAKGVNDIHRDIIDIVQGDATLAHLAGDGFTALPQPIGAPAPFQLNDAQTAFLKQFDLAVTNLGNESIALVSQAHPAATDVQAEITKLMAFATNADNFSASQGGLYSARFDNELRDAGNNGTIVKEIVSGLESHDKALVIDAANQLVQNAADVSGNQAANDGSHPTPAPLAAVPDAHVAQSTPAPTPTVPDPVKGQGAAPQVAQENGQFSDHGPQHTGLAEPTHEHVFAHTHWDA